MARSIHTTRRDVARLEASEYSDHEAKGMALGRAREALARKRRIKRAVQRERARPPAGITLADHVPVVVTETGEHVHHVASVADVREVLRRLPPGVLDGLTRIELQLGAEYLVECERKESRGATPDPLVGRLGHDTFPGVYSGGILGTYEEATAVIRLNAYVYDESAPLRDIWEPLLVLQSLSVLVHEVGHHYDNTMRVARGRWLAHDEWLIERYAEDREQRWTLTAVIPYLREAYAERFERTASWIAYHGGASLTLENLAGEFPDAATGPISIIGRTFWSMPEFIEQLIKHVQAGVPLQDCRVQFARMLHWRELYVHAHRILDLVLAEEPDHVGARTLRADIFVHEQRHADALDIARAVVQASPTHLDAWLVVADACDALGYWHDVVAAIGRIQVLDEDWDPHRRFHRIMQRAHASLHLGDVDGAQRDLASLEPVTTMSGRKAGLQQLRDRIADVTARRGAELTAPA